MKAQSLIDIVIGMALGLVAIPPLMRGHPEALEFTICSVAAFMVVLLLLAVYISPRNWR